VFLIGLVSSLRLAYVCVHCYWTTFFFAISLLELCHESSKALPWDFLSLAVRLLELCHKSSWALPRVFLSSAMSLLELGNEFSWALPWIFLSFVVKNVGVRFWKPWMEMQLKFRFYYLCIYYADKKNLCIHYFLFWYSFCYSGGVGVLVIGPLTLMIWLSSTCVVENFELCH